MTTFLTGLIYSRYHLVYSRYHLVYSRYHLVSYQLSMK